jgi:hypothetical protein
LVLPLLFFLDFCLVVSQGRPSGTALGCRRVSLALSQPPDVRSVRASHTPYSAPRSSAGQRVTVPSLRSGAACLLVCSDSSRLAPFPSSLFQASAVASPATTISLKSTYCRYSRTCSRWCRWCPGTFSQVAAFHSLVLVVRDDNTVTGCRAIGLMCRADGTVGLRGGQTGKHSAVVSTSPGHLQAKVAKGLARGETKNPMPMSKDEDSGWMSILGAGK